MTSQKKHLRVDLHTHILPKHLPNLSEKYGPGFLSIEPLEDGSSRMMLDGKPFRDIQCNCWDPQTRIDECTDTSVDVQVLSTIPVLFNYWADPNHCLEMAIYLNDDIAQTIATYPTKFIGLGVYFI